MELFKLTNRHGLTAVITNYGARVVSLSVPDRDGVMRDVVLGFDRPEDYLRESHLTDFGAVIGRYANRLGNGLITVDGRTIQLPQNNGLHCLHGGPTGWQYGLFRVLEQTDNSRRLELVSPDGDNNFPGTVTAKVQYTLTDTDALDIRYRATTDAPTVINMTNHSYFNLNCDGCTTVLNHLLTIDADQYTPIDNTSLPLGPLDAVQDTPFDFRTAKAIGRDIEQPHPQLVNGSGYDHNWVLNAKGDFERVSARLESPATGIVMELRTTEPGLQVYTGNFQAGHPLSPSQRGLPRDSEVPRQPQSSVASVQRLPPSRRGVRKPHPVPLHL